MGRRLRVKAELFQAGIVVIDDLRHEFVEAHEGAQILFEDLQPVLFLLAFLQAVVGIANQHRVAGFFSPLKHLLRLLECFHRRFVALLPALRRRLADIGNGRIALVRHVKRRAKLLDFLPGEDARRPQLVVQGKDQVRVRHVGQFRRLVIGLEGTQDIVGLVEEVQHEGAGFRLVGVDAIQARQRLQALHAGQVVGALGHLGYG